MREHPLTLMSTLDLVSIILSLVVAVMAFFSAYVSYLNLKAVTSVTLYLFPETKDGVLDNTNYMSYPDRLREAVLQNLGTLPPQNPIRIRWFDLMLGNTGPGLALILSWETNYNNKYRDSSEMKCSESFFLGPQAKMPIVGYIPKDYSPSILPTIFSQFTKVGTDNGRFPWKVKVIYEKQRGVKRAKYGLEFEVEATGQVKAIPFTVDK